MDFELINNPWIVSIVTSIFGGIFVYYVVKLFIERRKSKEEIQKINAANKDVLYSIRSCIAEGEVPEKIIMDGLIAATARKHGVTKKSMLSAREFLEELIKEIMDSSFLQQNKKSELCDIIKKHYEYNEETTQVKMFNDSKKEELLTITSALSVSALIFILTLKYSDNLRKIDSGEMAKNDIAMIIIMMMSLTFLAMALLTIIAVHLNKITRKRDKNAHDEEPKKSIRRPTPLQSDTDQASAPINSQRNIHPPREKQDS